MKWLIKLAWLVLGQHFKQRLWFQTKRRSVVAYIHALKVTRQFVILLVVALLLLQLIIVGGIGALVTGFILWNAEFQFKMEILFGIFVGLFLIPTVIFSAALSQYLWYRASGAQRMVEDLQRKS